MDRFAGKTAVITGGASGIGRSLAEQCARRQMQIVLADIEVDALHATADALQASGAELLAVPCDVSEQGQVAALAEAAFDRFGAVHLLFNNAGVAGGMNSWMSTPRDWAWVIGVNLMGVIHGLHAFVPRMLAHGEDGHIVNTASIAGLISGSSMAAYRTTKHAVVALSETLYLDLQAQDAPLGVSVLCPAWVRTGIAKSERNRPNALRNGSPTDGFTNHDAKIGAAVQRSVAQGSEPAKIAAHTFDAIRDNRFYVLPHPQYKGAVAQRLQAILDETDPIDPW